MDGGKDIRKYAKNYAETYAQKKPHVGYIRKQAPTLAYYL